MTLPEGRLVRSRVVADPGVALASALDRSLTGYALLEPQDALLLDADTTGVIAFREGVPVAAFHRGTGRGGPEALADLAVPGPYRMELHGLADPSALAAAGRRVPPAMPAERLAGDSDLAARTRSAASTTGIAGEQWPPADGGHRTTPSEAGDPSPSAPEPGTDHPGPAPTNSGPGSAADPGESARSSARGGDAVAAFLADDEKIEALREQARAEARERAAEWGLSDQLCEED